MGKKRGGGREIKECLNIYSATVWPWVPLLQAETPGREGHSSLCWICFYLEFQFRQKKPTVRRKNNTKIPHFLFQGYPS